MNVQQKRDATIVAVAKAWGGVNALEAALGRTATRREIAALDKAHAFYTLPAEEQTAFLAAKAAAEVAREAAAEAARREADEESRAWSAHLAELRAAMAA
jgi:hypothetical protein